jgi:hypothetical protein
MTMQISSLEVKKMYKSLTPGFIAGVITLLCGTTALHKFVAFFNAEYRRVSAPGGRVFLAAN